ncbi:acyl-CoA dehydrogenase family protein [Nocardioides sp. BYT-33-1]|uniref:acyl-CoA dehydrogenase family protein n=1 Tax=Nocardioides sp. BYT-33-1 TaxID=3416952 RepID=UPI003F53E421
MPDIAAEFTAFLDDVLPADYEARYEEYRHDNALRAAYQARAFDEGWLVPDGAVGLGGRGLDATDALAVRLVGAERRVPRLVNIQGAGVAAPALAQFGTPEQKELLAPTLRGDLLWALGMSEPGAGSDLASMRTTATREGEEYVISGQKVWTTQADVAQWCTLYARTDPAAPRHRGISCFVLDLSLPGIEIRPIPTASPAIEEFCEVFLEDVRVPASAVLGEVDQGWTVARASLEHERDMIWINTWLESLRALDPLVDGSVSAVGAEGTDGDLGRLLARTEALRLTGLRAAAHRWRGDDTGLATILKLFGSETVRAAADLTLEVAGPHALDRTPIFDERMEALAATIYGGTSEIQRNIIAERTLGLPRG